MLNDCSDTPLGFLISFFKCGAYLNVLINTEKSIVIPIKELSDKKRRNVEIIKIFSLEDLLRVV